VKLRGLDVDDLLILAMLFEEYTTCVISEKLGISQSAVSQRIRKMQSYLGTGIITDTKKRTLTPEGQALGKDCRDALLKLNRNFDEPFEDKRVRAISICH